MKMQVNSFGLIQNLRSVFSDSSKVLSELIQNGRRAGATEIHIEHTTDDETGKHTLTVRDNGCGISDFQKLLTVAESGWDSNTTAKESPYGMGAIAMLFACDSVTVASGEQEFSFDCQDALTNAYLGEPCSLSSPIDGCIITLHGYQHHERFTAHQLEQIAIFSSVPIYFNGNKLSSEFSLQNMKKVAENDPTLFVDETEVGTFIHRLNSDNIAVVLQDLLVYSGGYYHPTANTYFRPTLFASNELKARMPDRDTLINEAEALDRIKQVRRELVKKHLKAIRAEMGNDAEFVDRYFDVITSYDREVLNDIPYLPKKAFDGAPYPCMRDDYDNGMRVCFSDLDVTFDFVTPDTCISVYDDNDLGCFDETPLAHLFAWGKKAFSLMCQLDPEHWIYEKKLSLDDASFGVRVTNESEPFRFATDYYASSASQTPPARLVDTIELFDESAPDDAVSIALGLFIDDFSFTFDSVRGYYVQYDGRTPPQSRIDAFILRGIVESEYDAQNLLLCHNAYTYDYEWIDESLERDAKDFIAQLQAVMGYNLADIMKRFLLSIPATARQAMANKQFVVACNEKGELKVQDAA
jgi:hypothetical protein